MVKMNTSKKLSDARKKADKLGENKVRRHVVMCYDRKEADCASRKEMEASWSHLKKRLKELGLSKPKTVTRIPTLCLDVCKGGPIMIVYPEGTWYGDCTPKVIDEILAKHVLAGTPVQEFVLAQPPLCIKND